MSVALVIGLVLTSLLLPPLPLAAQRNWRIGRRPCPHCRQRLGATAASTSLDLYDRPYRIDVPFVRSRPCDPSG
jgi:hypothetical protein